MKEIIVCELIGISKYRVQIFQLFLLINVMLVNSFAIYVSILITQQKSDDVC